MIGDIVHEIRVMEPTSNVMHWMDLSVSITDVIQTSCPAYLYGQPLKVFFSSGPPEYADHYIMWLRNSLLVHFPDNKFPYNPVHLNTIALDGLQRIFKGSVTTPSTAFLPHLLLPTTDLQWREQIPSDLATLLGHGKQRR